MMKAGMIKIVESTKMLPIRMSVFMQRQASRIASEKRGEVGIASMVAMTVVVVGVILGLSATFNEGANTLVKEVFKKITDLLTKG